MVSMVSELALSDKGIIERNLQISMLGLDEDLPLLLDSEDQCKPNNGHLVYTCSLYLIIKLRSS